MTVASLDRARYGQARQTVASRGQAACAAGVAREANPYGTTRKDLRQEWFAGWDKEFRRQLQADFPPQKRPRISTVRRRA